MPWILAKDEVHREQLDSVMNHLAESLRYIAILLQPFLPHAPKKMIEQLGLSFDALNWSGLSNFSAIPENIKVIEKGIPIFPRLDVKEEVAYIRGLMQSSSKDRIEENAEQNMPKKPETEQISIDDFMKTDLRVAQIIAAEKIKKSDKLLKLKIDLGEEKRQVVSGIAEHYAPEDLIGKKIVCVTNLKPVKLRGELSEGMILAGSTESGIKVIFVDERLQNGSKVK